MKSTAYNFRKRLRARIFFGLAFFVAIGLCLIYFKNTTPEATPTEQSLGKTGSETSLELFDETSNVHAHFQHTANKNFQETNPSKQNLQSIRYAMQRDARYLTYTTNPDGSKAVHLNGTCRMATAARRLPDGTFEIRCFENFEDLDNFVDTSQK